MHKQTDRQTDRQANIMVGDKYRQTDGQTSKQADNTHTQANGPY